MARRAAAAGVVALALGWAIWSGCQGQANHGNPAGGSAGQATDALAEAPDAGGAASGGTGGGDAMTADAGPPYPGAEACEWAGWYASPALPKGCLSVCVPDDITARVPALKWDDRSDWCPGCKWLEPKWWPGALPGNAAPVEPYLQAFGPGPDMVELGLRNPDKSGTAAIYDSLGNPVASIRVDVNACTTLAPMMIGQDGTTAMRYHSLVSVLTRKRRNPDHPGVEVGRHGVAA